MQTLSTARMHMYVSDLDLQLMQASFTSTQCDIVDVLITCMESMYAESQLTEAQSNAVEIACFRFSR